MRAAEFDKPTRELAAYAAGLRESVLGPAAVESTKRHLLDSIGCALGAISAGPAIIARKLACASSSESGASVLGLEKKTTPELAAFANTVMIRYLDFNDTGIGGHPSDMIPAILAPAEAARASGLDVIKAISAAYEVVAGLRRGGLYGTLLREKHVDQVQSVIGSSVGASMVLGLDLEQTANAISLAITPSIPLRVARTGVLSDWKGCATAHSSMTAVFAARLAKEGMTGPKKPFEGIAGLYDLIEAGPFELAKLGVPKNGLSAIDSTGFKKYPAEYSAQGPIEVMLRLRHAFDVDDVENITVTLHRSGWQEIGGGQGDRDEKWDPTTRESADHSLPYLLAVALVDGKVTLESFAAERIVDPKLRPVMEKIRIVESAELSQEHAGELPKWPSVTEVILKNGGRLSQHSGVPKGHPLNPLSEAELEQKFMDLSLRTMSEPNARTLLEGILYLEELHEIDALARLFRFHASLL